MRTKEEISAFLKEQSTKYPQFQQFWTSFEELHEKRLWHQLTVQLLKFLESPDAKNTNLVALYDRFLIDFEMKINPLTLTEMVVIITYEVKEYESQLKFVEKMKEKVKNNREASNLCSVLMGRLKLTNGDMRGVKDILGELSPVFDEETGVTPIHGRYFQLSSDYYQISGNHYEYYRNALRYLGCTDLSKIPNEELQKRAFALALAALLGDKIFNFGELLQHEIIKHLEKEKWLVDLLNAFNFGDLEAYERLRPLWTQQADLKRSERNLTQKICLLCLMEMAFKSTNGVLSFTEIAEKTKLNVNEVEFLVMKALSLGLVKGSIDEVEQKVHLTWVQPRVLDKQQIVSLRSKLDVWCKSVREMEKVLESKAGDIIAN
ncbi:26S proteasome non-ATPase regulatory subunit 13-like protein [Leptotrombidium deliense]|uniref:26S proteasome non-ATPase regulatory subunit 13 n=1 Tax=Leptotrombidium deliense TaxID=299467 RepID=A0A443RZ57_9ACAR|nr:26S proteasome non-ATPase regulatory subunit 13-like protein [Leptotrombidium deliense]